MNFTSQTILILLTFVLFSCKNPPRSPETSVVSEKMENQENKNPAQNFLILNGQVGDFKIGGNIPEKSEIYQIEKRKETRYTDDGPVEETLYFFSKKGKESIALKAIENSMETEQQKIGEIWVLSENFKTEEGIGVGSTLEEFVTVYPNYKLWYTYVSDRYVLENSKSEVQFLLNGNDFMGEKKADRVKVPLNIDDFKPESKISKIRVYRK